ncbi:hypothetical protein B0T14DRAFT_519097 [Immersiella caudata]|uniref:Uncharacterized protein n=1 Tax=Immersiella caudata TaxID=314043 RepID=A0AA39WPS4_9PEZI|nr:hypothetical protein B0T14DRAFT_519097 [Immersiella caudata]
MTGGLSNSRHAPASRPYTHQPHQPHHAHQPATTNPRTEQSTAAPPPPVYTPFSIGPKTPKLRPPNLSQTGSQFRSPPNLTLAAAELSRYTKIVRRLKWKLPFLSTAYAHATTRAGVPPDLVTEAELMFKLDFFEYYMLLERALVHLQSVFGIEIPRGGYVPRVREQGLNGSLWRGGGSHQFQHRYHANVLAALDDEGNPLHEALGKGEVRKQLSRAKDLRNRWKTAGEDEDEEGGAFEGRRSRSPGKRMATAPLESYDLERILGTIFDGFDRAFLVAERYVKGGEGGEERMESGELAMEGETEEEEWAFIADAMDWEAV